MPKVEIILIPPNKKVEIFLPERLTLVEKILPLFQQNGKETLNPPIHQ